MAGVLSVTLDIQEPRLVLDRQAQVIDGRDWDMPLSSEDVYVEFVTNTLMLTPLCLTHEWQTTAEGDYKRLRKADYTLTTPARWSEHSPGRFNGDKFLHALDVNEKVYTSESYERNRGMFLSWIAYNPGNADFVQMECGWAEGSDAEVSLRFKSDGGVEVWRNGLQFEGGDINTIIAYPSQYGTNPVQGQGKRLLANQIVEVVLIPCRRRELLVLSNQGGGFVTRFEDIDENDPAPILHEAGHFWWYVPEGQATVQAAPLRFRTSGYAVSAPYPLRKPPRAGMTPEVSLYADAPGYGTQDAVGSLVTLDGVTAFVANGSAVDTRLRVDMAGDGKSTPFVYGLAAVWPGLTANTPAGGTVVDDWLRAQELSVGEKDATLHITVRAPGEVESAGASNISNMTNRSIQASIGTVAMFTGRVNEPSGVEGVTDAVSEVTLACRDYDIVLEKHLLLDREPFDGLRLDEAFRRLLHQAGFDDSYLDIDTIPYVLPSVGAASKGEWALQPEPGDTCLKWIDRLWETFAQTCFFGWVPTLIGPQWKFKLPESLATIPDVTVYLTSEDAQTYGQGEQAWDTWARSYKPHTLPPEANDIWVIGRDPRSNLPLVGRYEEVTSLDPTLPVGLRPDNWQGEPARYSLVDPSLTTMEDVTYCLAILRQRLTPARLLCEIEAEKLFKANGVPLWRGDCLGILGKGRWRVKTISGKHELEYNNEWKWRPYVYASEWIGW